MKRGFLALASLTAALCAGCRQEAKTSINQPAAGAETVPSSTAFTDVTLAAGITHRHHKPILDHKLDNIMA